VSVPRRRAGGAIGAAAAASLFLAALVAAPAPTRASSAPPQAASAPPPASAAPPPAAAPAPPPAAPAPTSSAPPQAAPAPPQTAPAPSDPAPAPAPDDDKAPAAPEKPAQPAQPVDDPRLSEAKELFQRGNELRKIGDCQRALELYLRSRQIVPSVPNTVNAAFCLEQLGRYDEALELYEALLTVLRAELTDELRKNLAPTMAALRGRIGSAQISSNVDGQVLIDGRARGKLPLLAPLRLLPGAHTLRVVKDGYATYERVISVRLGETASIDARLEPLTSSGRLRVADERLVGADLYIDGTLVGQLPWEGTLAPGPHFYSVRGGELGSAPREASVVAGQTTAATVEAGPLGPEIRVVVQPLTADLSLNGVPVGKGQWRGALPLGRHTIEAHEPGYFAKTIRPTIDRSTTGEVRLTLPVDPDHPRWGRKAGVFWLEGFGGYAFARSLGSRAEEFCDQGNCLDRSRPSGAMVGLRGGYELPIGISLEVTAAYLTLGSTFTRRIQTTFRAEGAGEPSPITYTLHDEVDFTGPVVAAGAGYRLGLTSWLDAGAALGLGVVLAGTTDAISGTATAGGETLAVNIPNAGRTLSSGAPFVMPELRLKLRFGHFTAGAGVAVALFLIDGPPHETLPTSVVDANCPQNPGTVHCAGAKNVVFEERAYGTFTMFFPGVTAGYRF